jgi:glutamate-1-semialdehyde 2,1-aminomutase
MELVAPSGPVYQAGTLSGNPLAMTAGFETLSILRDEKGFYRTLETKCRALEQGIQDNIRSLSAPLMMNRVGSMSTLFFTDQPVKDYRSALNSDTKRFGVYFREMMNRGIYLAPSQFEAGFVSIAHVEEDVEKTVKANREALRIAFA